MNDQAAARAGADFSPLAECTLSVEGKIVETGPLGRWLFFEHEGAVVGSRLGEALRASDPLTCERLVASCTAERTPRTAELQVSLGSRSLTWLLAVAVPQLAATGEVTAIRVLLLDLSEQKWRERTLQLFADASRALGASSDLQATLQNVAALIVPTLADLCILDLDDGPGQPGRRVVLFADAQKQEALAGRLTGADPLGVRAAALARSLGGEAVLLEDIRPHLYRLLAEAAPEAELFAELGLCSAMVVPLRNRERTFGAMTFASAESKRHYSGLELRLAENLAARVALMLDNLVLHAALRDSEQRASAILAVSADAIVSVGEDQRIVQFNDGAEKIFGYRKAQVLGLPLDVLVPERLRPLHRAHVQAFSREGAASRMMGGHEVQIVGLRRDRTEFPAEAAISQVEVRGQKLLTVALRDITERKRAEDALRASEEKYRTLFQSIDEGFCLIEVLFDAQGVPHDFLFLEVNEVFEKQTGIAHAVGRCMRDIAPHLEKHWFQMYGVVARTGESRRVQLPADALGRFYDVFAFRVGAPGQNQVAVLLNDISERHRAEQDERFLADLGLALSMDLRFGETFGRVAELSLRHLADICIVDLYGHDGIARRERVVSADPALAQVCEQLRRVDLRPGRPSLEAQTLEEARPTLRTRLSEAELAAFAQSPEHLAALRAAAPRSVLSVPLTARGKAIGALVFLSRSFDFVEEDLRLAQAIAARAALALENARLYETAADAVQARDDLLAIVAHDLRSPLSIIRLNAQQMLRRAAGSDRRSGQPGERIESAVTRMDRLIEDLLHITRLESGRLTVNPASIEARKLLTELLQSHFALAAAASVRLEIDFSAEVGPVWADRDRLQQVLENLLGNALKFSRPGGRILIRVEPDGAMVRFSVVDQGKGIAAEDLPHVFDRFWQTRVKEKPGLGLGLTIVKGIVEAHRGQVWAESQLGVGSTFSFTLPLVAAQLAQAAAAVEGAPAAAPTAPFALVAEDDMMLRESLCDRLREAGYRAAGVSNGAEALELVRRGMRPDLILLDLEMPVMDGRSFLEARVLEPSLATIPVVAISGKVDPAQASAWGASAWLRKPLDSEQLLATVGRVLH